MPSHQILAKYRMKRTAQIFLCYARQDETQVKELYNKLKLAGFAPWMDKEDILPGEVWPQVIIKAIKSAHFFLACLSKNSVYRRGFLQREIKTALDVYQERLASDIYLIPGRLEHCEVPESLAKFQWVDLFKEEGIKRLGRAIETGMKKLYAPVKAEVKHLTSQHDIDEIIEAQQILTAVDVKEMLAEKDYYAKGWYSGKGVQHNYKSLKHDGEKLIIDYATNLTWQQSGSKVAMTFSDAEQHIDDLNEQNFAGYSSWRLPTLEEAISLMEPEKRQDGLYIDEAFDRKQKAIWTSDKYGEEYLDAWVVNFNVGNFYDLIAVEYYVRAIRHGIVKSKT